MTKQEAKEKAIEWSNLLSEADAERDNGCDEALSVRSPLEVIP